jgi:hypothetical protein
MAETIEREIPPFEEFSMAPVFGNLKNINRFELLVEVPKLYRITGSSASQYLVGTLYDEVTRALEAASFYAFDRLRPVLDQNRAGVAFEDDDYGFQIVLDADGDIVLARSGSSFQRFHEWYRRLMPSVESLVNRLVVAFAEVVSTHRKTHSSDEKDVHEVHPVMVSYSYNFVGYDFKRPPAETLERNVAIMTRLLGVVPQEDGHLVAVPERDIEALREYGRLDVTLSRWSENPGGKARQLYSVSAPGNRRHSTVFFNFSYRGETYQDPATGERHLFDPSDFLKFFEIPYVAFLKEKALEGFLTDLTDGFVFETTTGSLP